MVNDGFIYSPFTIYHSRLLSRLLFLRALFGGRLFARDRGLLRAELRLQGFGGRARQDELLVVEHVVDVDARRADDLRRLHVARGEQEVVVVNRVHDERLAFEAERRERSDELLRLRLSEDQLLDDDDV